MAADRKERLVFRRNGITRGPGTKWRTVLLWAPLVASPPFRPTSPTLPNITRGVLLARAAFWDTIIKAARRVTTSIIIKTNNTHNSLTKVKISTFAVLFVSGWHSFQTLRLKISNYQTSRFPDLITLFCLFY